MHYYNDFISQSDNMVLVDIYAVRSIGDSKAGIDSEQNAALNRRIL